MIPRPEFPRPQFYRGEASWINLNGEWDFELDLGASGHERWMHEREYTGKITVPFAPESKLSGIEYTDFIAACWYRRRFERPAGFDGKRERLLLHFGAVDYEATVWINLQKIGYHMGGYTPFTVDITDVLQENNTVCVWAKSDVRSPLQPSGKQAMRYPNEGCMVYPLHGHMADRLAGARAAYLHRIGAYDARRGERKARREGDPCRGYGGENRSRYGLL